MKFDILYPEQPFTIKQKSIEFEGSSLFRYGLPEPCWNCGELTSWIDENFAAHLCSEECERQKWAEYSRDSKL